MQIRTELLEGGQLVVPPQIVKALNLHDGETVTFELNNGEVKIFSAIERIRRAREIFQQNPAYNTISVDDFLEEKHLAAQQEIAELS